MIICPNPHPDYPNEWMLVKQSEHDDHCGYIATHLLKSPLLWKSADPYLLTLAVALHDTGSANSEDFPFIHAEGRPVSYWTVDADEHIELHKHGVRVAQTVHPYVALLISMHVVGIHRDRLHIDTTPNRWHIPEAQTPKVNAFVAEQEALQAQLRREAERLMGQSLPMDRLMNDFKLFELIDILSTQFSACGLGSRSMNYVPDPAGKPFTMTLERAGEWDFKVTPFPFAGNRFECPTVGRRVPKRTFVGHDDFRAAWYAAEPVILPYACVA